MIRVPDGVEQAWLRDSPAKATDADIAMLEATFGVRMPRQYVDFVKQHGFVKFGLDANDTRIFTVVHEREGLRELRQATAGFLVSPDRAVQTFENFTDKSDPESEELPLIPDGYFPAGNDNGQGLILIELASGKVWFWRESAWRWGTEDNTRLGFVADDFDGFINALRPEIE